jgi:hypothetical protein
MKSLQELASEFGTHDYCIESWINKLKVTKAEIDFALTHFDKSQRRTIMSEYFRPMAYLAKHTELINHVQRIGVENIKNLPEAVYLAHLEQLKESDRIDDCINNRSNPYNSYDAEVFCALRHSTKKAEIRFVQGMFGRSISHHSYTNAKRKLSVMVLSFAA